MLRIFVALLFGALFASGTALARSHADDRAATEDPPAAVQEACQAEAERRFQQIPSVQAGLTTYMPGERERFYRECLEERGYKP